MFTEDVVDFTQVVTEAGLSARQIKDILRAARRHNRLCVRWCDGDDVEAALDSLEASIRNLLKDTGVEPVFGRDPRGATVKLRLPSGKTNDWGHTGWCVPV